MLITSIQSKFSGSDIYFKNEYKTVCSGVKKTSNAKKTTPHKLEIQFNQLANIIDKKPNGFIMRKKQLKNK
jgi:hypothetical protein